MYRYDRIYTYEVDFKLLTRNYSLEAWLQNKLVLFAILPRAIS